MSSDSMTVLLARSGFMTKSIADGAVVRGYNAGTFYRVRHAGVASFTDMVCVLEKASGIPEAGIIRGDLLPDMGTESVRRLSNRAKHGDDVTFAAAARQWLGIDMDAVPEPAGLDFATDPEEGVEHVIGHLPDEFADASCWWQATSSGGIKAGINCRLWYWLSRPIEDTECKGWLRPFGADCSIYNPAAIHYVAAPIILSGPDPMARRQGVRQGLEDTIEVPAELPKIETVEPIHVDVVLKDLSQLEQRRVAAAIKNSPVAREIWNGERDYPDRSTRHFAFIGGLIRAGICDFDDCEDWPELVAFAVVKLDQKLGIATSKATRPDYIGRTIGAVLAREAGPQADTAALLKKGAA
jgi:hypothetical protein